jgi:hypothetical protein
MDAIYFWFYAHTFILRNRVKQLYELDVLAFIFGSAYGWGKENLLKTKELDGRFWFQDRIQEGTKDKLT